MPEPIRPELSVMIATHDGLALPRRCLDGRRAHADGQPVELVDEAFRPTEWDEADVCFRIRAAGWKTATHGYERRTARFAVPGRCAA